jgi:hypothetical protein
MPQDDLSRRNSSHLPALLQPIGDYDRLGVFIGAWHTEGRQLDGLVGAEARISAVDTFEWLTGCRFVVHRFEGRVGDAEAACIEVIGHDPARNVFPAHTFYNNGVVNRWEYDNDGATWSLAGDFEIAGERRPVRCTMRLDERATTMTARWEYLHDGAWWAFWETESKKVQ